MALNSISYYERYQVVVGRGTYAFAIETAAFRVDREEFLRAKLNTRPEQIVGSLLHGFDDSRACKVRISIVACIRYEKKICRSLR